MWRASVAGNIREEQKEVTWESQAWAARENSKSVSNTLCTTGQQVTDP